MYLAGKGNRLVENFNLDWIFLHENEGEWKEGGAEPVPGADSMSGARAVKLPHDWSLEYPFEETALSCGSGGYVVTGRGWYKKLFAVAPAALEEGRVWLSFDGAYMLAKVWINGRYLGRHVYGYTPFAWDVTDFLRADGGENVVDVEVDNSAQPSSRWYSGSGITRDVWISRVKPVHVAPCGVYVRQPEVTPELAGLIAETRVEVPEGAGEVTVKTCIAAPDGAVCAQAETVAVRSERESGEKERESAERSDGISPEAARCGHGISLEAARCGHDISPEAVPCGHGISPEGSSGAISKIIEAASVCTQRLAVSNPLLWSVEEPQLYEVITQVFEDGVLQDEVHTQIGLRSAEFDSEKGFLLNGRRVKLNGFCIHHDGGSMGAAVPLPIWERRLEKMKKMGANAVRMSHNPPDPGLLMLCDRMGFLVMDEAFDEWRVLKGKELGSNTHESRGYSEWFEQCHEEDIKAMLYRDRNHPSIVIWSIGNEVPDQVISGGHLTARMLKGICKRLDPERAVTQANDQICAEPWAARTEFLEELDVVGYNYVGRWRTRAETFYDDDKRAHPDWCVIGTENGGLGGVRGEYSLKVSEHAGWWTKPYYSAPAEVGKLLKFTMTHDYVAGDFMWTGIDYLGEAHWPKRSASAGVLDTCGFEKDSFYFYKSVWNMEEPTVHLLPHWNLNVEEGKIVSVLGYTNCDSAELFLNGKSYGKKARSYPAYGMTERYGHFDTEPQPVNTDDLFLSWDVPYEPGCIELVGYRGTAEIARHTVRTAGNPAKICVTCYQNEAKADGLDIGQIEVEIRDEHGCFCPHAEQELTFTVCGPASVIGVDNGNPAGLESMKADHIHAFHGRAFAVVQSDGQAGECLVKVSGGGLEEGSAVIRFVR